MKAEILAYQKCVPTLLQAPLWKTQHQPLLFKKKNTNGIARGVPTSNSRPLVFVLLFQPFREGGWALGLLVLPKVAHLPLY